MDECVDIRVNVVKCPQTWGARSQPHSELSSHADPLGAFPLPIPDFKIAYQRDGQEGSLDRSSCHQPSEPEFDYWTLLGEYCGVHIYTHTFMHTYTYTYTCALGAYKDKVSIKRMTGLYSNLKIVLGVKCGHQGKNKTRGKKMLSLTLYQERKKF